MSAHCAQERNFPYAARAATNIAGLCGLRQESSGEKPSPERTSTCFVIPSPPLLYVELSGLKNPPRHDGQTRITARAPLILPVLSD